MKAQMKAVMASAVVIVLALAAVSGVTYSWFSDTDDTEVTISTGVVSIIQTINDEPTISSSTGTQDVDTTNLSFTLGPGVSNIWYVNIQNKSTMDVDIKTWMDIEVTDEINNPTDFDERFTDLRENLIVDYGNSFDLDIIYVDGEHTGSVVLAEWTTYDYSSNGAECPEETGLTISLNSESVKAQGLSINLKITTKAVQEGGREYTGEVSSGGNVELEVVDPNNDEGKVTIMVGDSNNTAKSVGIKNVSASVQTIDGNTTVTLKATNNSGDAVTNFGDADNPVSIPVSITLSGVYSEDNFTVIYDGIESQPSDIAFTPNTDGTTTVSWTTTHFSQFVIVPIVTANETLSYASFVRLTKDITLDETFTIPEGKTMVLDLNKYSIEGVMHKNDGAVLKNMGTLIVKNGTISSTADNGGSTIMNIGAVKIEYCTLNGAPEADSGWPSYTVNNVGAMEITNSTITSHHGALCSYNNGAATMNNTDIEMTGISGFTSHGIYTYGGGTVVVNGGNIANNATDQNATGASVINGSVTVNSGTFSGRIEAYYGTPEIKGGIFTDNPSKYMSQGYTSVDKNGKWFVVPTNVSVVGNNDEFEQSLRENVNIITIVLAGDVSYDIDAWQNNAIGSEITETVTIIGNGHTITFNQTNSDWNNIVTNGSKLIIKDAKITNSGHNDGPWNRHDLNFACDVDIIDVVSDKALAFKSGASLKNVIISDNNTSDTYAVWIQPNGQTVTIDGCTIDMLECNDGRGIKIDEQYVDDPQKVTLNVSNTTFKTEEKSAILVKSKAGADITVCDIIIAEVADDSTNAVWVDEGSNDYFDLVKVTGSTVINEP